MRKVSHARKGVSKVSIKGSIRHESFKITNLVIVIISTGRWVCNLSP